MPERMSADAVAQPHNVATVVPVAGAAHLARRPVARRLGRAGQAQSWAQSRRRRVVQKRSQRNTEDAAHFVGV